jgi:hypothetical protein
MHNTFFVDEFMSGGTPRKCNIFAAKKKERKCECQRKLFHKNVQNLQQTFEKNKHFADENQKRKFCPHNCSPIFFLRP